MNIEEVLCRALQQKGDRYVYGSEVPLTAQDGVNWDCSELVQWSTKGAMPDGAWAQYMACKRAGTMLTVAQAMKTRGALLFVGDGTGTGRDAITHVAFSLGDGTTIEARGSRWGVGCWAAAGRFNFGARIPGVDYSVRPYTPPPKPVVPRFPGKVLVAVTAGAGTRTVQLRLRDLGIYKYACDDVYGKYTAAAVTVFQRRKGLQVDGKVGKETWGALWK